MNINLKTLSTLIFKLFFDFKKPSGFIPCAILLSWTILLLWQIFQKCYVLPLFGYSAALDACKNGSSYEAASALGASIANSFYSAISSATGSLLGFLITAATIFLTLPSEGLFKRFAQNELLVKLFELFIYAVVATAITLILSLVAAFTRHGIHSFEFDYAIQIATLIALSFSLGYLLQCVHVLSDLGCDYLREVETQEIAKKNRKLEEIRERTGPPGTV